MQPTLEAEPVSVLLADVRQLCASGAARAIRAAANLTQAELARDLGSSPSAVARWESADARPTGDTAVRYLALLRRLERRQHTRFGRSFREAPR